MEACLEPKKYEVKKFELTNCLGGSKTFYFPKGWSKTSTYSYDHGYIESLIYPDSSIVSILCGFSTGSNPSDKFDINRHSRKERLFDRTVIYENVLADRKEEFDRVFDQMIE